MSQHDLNIANQGFPAFRADLNDALVALGSTNSGATAPTTTFANQLWYDTANNILKIRNEDNDAWISIATLDQSGDVLSVIALNTISEGTSGSGVTVDGVLLKDNAVTASADSTISGLTVGKGAGAVATNTTVGVSALVANTTGYENTAVGNSSLLNNTTGYSNTSVGVSALRFNNIGAENTAFGQGALRSNTTGSNNVAVGYLSLYSNTTSNQNTAVGYNAGYNNTTGVALNAFGYAVLAANTTGKGNSGFGGLINAEYEAALRSNTTGQYNSAFASGALANNTTGSNNTALGMAALYSNTTASFNTAVGFQAGYNTTTGTNNTFVGRLAGFANTTGFQNTGIGVVSLNAVTTGSGNTAIGISSLEALTTGTNNVGVGNNAGSTITTGANNIILGSYNGNAGSLDIRTANNNIVLADGNGNPRYVYLASGGSHFFSNTEATPVYGGDGLIVPYYNGNNRPAFRSYDVNSVSQTNNAWSIYRNGSQVGTVTTTLSNTSYNTSSDYRLKENIAPMTGALATVAQLKPVTYDWKIGGSGQGFIAHELAEIVPECVNGEKDAVDSEGKPVYQGIDTSFLVATLTAAIQELKAEFDAYKAIHP